MDNKTSHLTDEMIFKLGNFSEKLGLGKSMGQLYAALYLSSEPLTLTELARSCRMSKGNASINIRRLERWGAVKKTWGNNNRRDYYEANKNILDFGIKHMRDVLANILKDGHNIVSELKEKVDSIDDSRKEEEQQVLHYKKSIRDLKDLIDQIGNFIKNFEF